MAPVARELGATRGVLEPLQTADSLEGQVAELKAVLESNADLPVTLIGASRGAWLGLFTAARYPSLARKLILVGSGPFEERYAEGIMPTRLARLNVDERQEVQTLLKQLGGPADDGKKGSLARLGELLSRTDTLDPFDLGDELKLSMTS
jgi:pimeloyl-ACP methyl ester carboxylesterase